VVQEVFIDSSETG